MLVSFINKTRETFFILNHPGSPSLQRLAQDPIPCEQYEFSLYSALRTAHDQLCKQLYF